MGRVSIDGHTYNGSSVSIVNGVVTIDGVTQGEATGEVRLVIEGTLDSLETDASVNMTGTINGNLKAAGSVNCDNVGGNVSAGGSVNCDDVGGDVTAGGSVSRG